MISCSGYTAPEYVGDGIYSIKSDVYSFGALVLEIVSEEKNRGIFHEQHNNNLIGHVSFIFDHDRCLVGKWWNKDSL